MIRSNPQHWRTSVPRYGSIAVATEWTATRIDVTQHEDGDVWLGHACDRSSATIKVPRAALPELIADLTACLPAPTDEAGDGTDPTACRVCGRVTHAPGCEARDRAALAQETP